MWLPWRRRRRDPQARELPGGPPLRGPEFACYQYFFGDYSIVSKNGTLTLTATHLIFDGAVGADIPVRLLDLTEFRDQPIRRWHIGGFGNQLIIRTRAGKIGFLMDDPAGWEDAIRRQLRAAKGLPRERSAG